jgi:hypothetical protein
VSDRDLSDPAGTVVGMNEREPAELLMLTSVVRTCPDCIDERVFVAIDPDAAFEYACADCGAAIMIDPALDRGASANRRRHVA